MDALETALYHLVSRAVTDAVTPAVRAAVRTELARLEQRLALGPTLSREGAASASSLSVAQIDHLRKTGRLAYHKVGGRVVIKTEDLFAYLERGFVPAASGNDRLR